MHQPEKGVLSSIPRKRIEFEENLLKELLQCNKRCPRKRVGCIENTQDSYSIIARDI